MRPKLVLCTGDALHNIEQFKAVEAIVWEFVESDTGHAEHFGGFGRLRPQVRELLGISLDIATFCSRGKAFAKDDNKDVISVRNVPCDSPSTSNHFVIWVSSNNQDSFCRLRIH